MKSLKRIIKICFIILVSICVLFLGLLINGTHFSKYNEKKEDLTFDTWMENLKDEELITNVIIPGSHDSATYTMFYAAETQTYTINEQLKSGVRYFDLRVRYLEEKNRYVIYHSIINGIEAYPIIQDIKAFLLTHPTEFLILDFQHFENGAQEKVKEWIDENLYEYCLKNETTLSDMEFIAQVKVKDVRGKCIVLFGDGNSYCNENYLFARNSDSGSKQNMSLDSYYETELNGKKASTYIEEVLPYYIEKAKTKIEEETKALFVLQCQLTDTLFIFGPSAKERSNNKLMTEFIKSLKDSEDLAIINIIMRDFMTVEKVKDIVNLNYYKKTMDNLMGE